MRAAVDQVIKGTVANTLQEKANTQTGDRRAAIVDLAGHLRTAGIQAIESAVGQAAGARAAGEAEVADPRPVEPPMAVGPGL